MTGRNFQSSLEVDLSQITGDGELIIHFSKRRKRKATTWFVVL